MPAAALSSVSASVRSQQHGAGCTCCRRSAGRTLRAPVARRAVAVRAGELRQGQGRGRGSVGGSRPHAPGAPAPSQRLDTAILSAWGGNAVRSAPSARFAAIPHAAAAAARRPPTHACPSLLPRAAANNGVAEAKVIEAAGKQIVVEKDGTIIIGASNVPAPVANPRETAEVEYLTGGCCPPQLLPAPNPMPWRLLASHACLVASMQPRALLHGYALEAPHLPQTSPTPCACSPHQQGAGAVCQRHGC